MENTEKGFIVKMALVKFKGKHVDVFMSSKAYLDLDLNPFMQRNKSMIVMDQF